MVDAADGCIVTQGYLKVLEKRAERILMKFNKGKYKVRHLGRIEAWGQLQQQDDRKGPDSGIS